MGSRRSIVLGVVFLAVFLLPSRAEAYVDPGTGSYILQLVLAGLLGALFALKVFWHRMIQFFKNLFPRRRKLS